MNIPERLIQLGFKPHRKVFNGIDFAYTPCDYTGQYSSIVNGMLDYRFIKDDIEVIYGLNERGKPPTLIHPRPEGIRNDDAMNRLILDKHTEDEILQMIGL